MFEQPAILQAIARAARVIRRSVEIIQTDFDTTWTRCVTCEIKGVYHRYTVIFSDLTGTLRADKII